VAILPDISFYALAVNGGKGGLLFGLVI